ALLDLLQSPALTIEVYVFVDAGRSDVCMSQHRLNISGVHIEILLCRCIGVADAVDGNPPKLVFRANPEERAIEIPRLDRRAVSSCEDQFLVFSATLPSLTGNLTGDSLPRALFH